MTGVLLPRTPLVQNYFVANQIDSIRSPTNHLQDEEATDASDYPLLLHGGRLQRYWQVWQRLHCHPRVVQILSFGYQIIPQSNPPKSVLRTIRSGYSTPEKHRFLTDCVADMLKKGAIYPLKVCTTLGFCSRLFLVPKPGKKWRPVIDLSVLNTFLQVPTFKMETAEIIRNSLTKGEWLVSIDLKDAYFHVPIHPASHHLLRFHVDKQTYHFKALPFGLEFTRIVQEVKLVLQSRGICIHQYLDDWLLRANTSHQCRAQTKELIQVVQDLGFVINFEKSELEPTQKIDFLGYNFDLIQGKVFPTENKLKILEKAVQDMEVVSQTTPRLLMSLIGVLASLEKTIPMGRLHMCPFQWYLKTHWQYPQSLDLKIPVSNLLKSYLQWWKNPKNLEKGCPLHPQEHNTLIFTDASNQGWGAHLENLTVSGNWTDQEKLLHINVLELKAVFLALKSFQNRILDKRVLIATDNATVVSYLNKQGGTHSWDMCLLVWRIMAYCNPRNILIRARHIQGCLNVIADSLSRKDKIIQTEWSLHPQIFSLICKVWHTPMVDMFATNLNHKLPIYVSPVPDANAMNIDALNISWEGLDGYAFCPVALIPKVIQKMNTYRYRMIVVAPGWPRMHWFWDLVNLSTKPPLQLPHCPHLLKQPFSQKFHQNLMFLNLHVWHLDTTQNHLNHSLSRWQIELRHLKDPHLEDYMSQGGPFLNSGANRIRWSAQSLLSQT